MLSSTQSSSEKIGRQEILEAVKSIVAEYATLARRRFARSIIWKTTWASTVWTLSRSRWRSRSISTSPCPTKSPSRRRLWVPSLMEC